MTILTIFLSAFLLFLVQPLLGKALLPAFGGAPAVWTTLMFLFQTLLLMGYVYSNAIASKLPLRRQGRVHLVLLGVSVLALLLQGVLQGWRTPIVLDLDWALLGGADPVLRIVVILLVGVGLPYLVLSTTSPLLQAWFSRVQTDRSPYRLYALSNLGSLLALLSYPFVIEPALSVTTQATLWALAYVVFAACCCYVVVRLLRSPTTATERDTAETPPETGGAARLGVARPLLWLALSACPSILLLATTNQMTQDIAVVPFLWVLPLALYLLSFILSFNTTRGASRWFFVGLFVATLLTCWVLIAGNALHILVQLGVYSLLLFVACMVCHGELVRLRPGPEHLTRFYVMISLGGALGATFVSLGAPLLFSGTWEFPLGIGLCWVLLWITWQVDRSSPVYGKAFLPVVVMMVLASAVLALVTLTSVQIFRATSLEARRNFYGVLWVAERQVQGVDEPLLELGHGVTLHGAQYTSDARRAEPTSYYCEASGIGLTLRSYPRGEDGLRVGVVGLGVGTLATYGEPGDVFRFYEINPEVIRLAEGAGGYFTYLRDSRAGVEIVPGDARLSLERELAAGGSQRYDVLALDAFSSHSIPVHLLTRESFEVYLAHLEADGVLAAHIGNPHLDLQPVLAGLADHFDAQAVAIETQADGQACADSLWVLITRNAAFLDLPGISVHSRPLEDAGGRLGLWTDEYSNLFQVLR
jgi:Ca2+/Na+ antiporter